MQYNVYTHVYTHVYTLYHMLLIIYTHTHTHTHTGCLQGYVFENGPLSTESTLNYSYQLFEALDYLHQELRVIHCDIKRT